MWSPRPGQRTVRDSRDLVLTFVPPFFPKANVRFLWATRTALAFLRELVYPARRVQAMRVFKERVSGVLGAGFDFAHSFGRPENGDP